MSAAVFLLFALVVVRTGVVANYNIEFTVSVNGLPNPYDSYCKADVNNDHLGFRSLGQTEVDHVNRDPSWSKVFALDYTPHENTDLELYVWTQVRGSGDLFLGSCTKHVESIINGITVGSFQTTTCPLVGSLAGNSMDPGVLTLRYRIASTNRIETSSASGASRNYISLPSIHYCHSNIFATLSLTSYYYFLSN